MYFYSLINNLQKRKTIKMDEKIDDYNALMIATAVVGGIFIILGVIFYKDKFEWAKGVLFGTIFAMLKLALIKKTVSRAADMEESGARKYAITQYSVRYMLTAIVLIVAALEPSIDFLGVCVGLFTMKIGIYILLTLGKITK